jgi:hypothetical protein
MAIGRPIEQTPNIADKVVTATATAGQTQFTVDGGYRINHLAVFRNGVRLVNGNDYTALDGTTITLMEDASNLDVLEFQVFDTFNVSDALLTNAASQTVNGDVTVNGTFTVGSGGIGTFTAAEVVVGIVSSTTGITTVQSLQASSSTTTGALVVKGGVGIGKSLHVGGNISVGGTLTYEDVTNVDSVGVVTAGKGVRITTGGLVVTAGVSTFAGITTVTNTAALHSKQLNVSAGSTFGGAITASDNLTVSGTTTLSGDVSIADKIVHTGDTNTLIRFPAAGTIRFDTDGDERIRITSAGKVLIASNTSRSVWGANPQTQIEKLDSNAALSIIRNSNTNAGPWIALCKSRGTANGAVTIVQDGDSLGSIDWFGADGGDLANVSAEIKAEIDGTPGSNDLPGRMIFKTTADGAGSPTERLRIDSSGRLLLGTTTEGEATADNLTIADSGHCGITLRSGTSSVGTIFFSDSTSGTGEYEGYVQYDHTNNFLKWATGNTERMRLNSNGQISIRGTTTAFDTTGDLDSLQLYYETDSGQASIGPYSSGGSTYLSFYTNASGAAATEKLRIDSGGKILAGTTSSRNVAGGAAKLQIEATSSEGMSLTRTTDDNGSVYLSLGKTRNGSVCQAGDKIGTISWNADDGTDLAHASAEIFTEVASGIGGNDVPGDLVFKTNGGTTITSERLRITAGGYVGIGTQLPDKTGIQNGVKVLEISGGDGGELIVGNHASHNVSVGMHVGSLAFKNIDSSTGSVPHYAGIRCETSDTSGNMDLRFYTGINKFEADTPQVYINSLGRLLIGPTAERDVGGLSAQNLAIEGTDGASSSMALIDNQNSAAGSPSLSFAKSRGTSVGSNTIVQDGDSLGSIVWCAADGNDIANQSAYIKTTVDAAPGSNDTAGRLIFATSADGSSSPTSRMEINKDGLLYLNTNSYISANGDTRWRVQTGRNEISHNGTKTYTITGMAYGFARLTFGYYGEGCWINYCIQAGGYNSSNAGTQLYSYTEIVDQNGHYHSGSTADVTVTQNNASLVVVANHSAPTGNTGGQNGAYMFETCSWSGHPTLTVS